ncbi:hypothetical protein RJT34_12307 [Clitoria ternatea]|uniref:Uncharacterized protein n=1 Tax=Clitoria ternatea TaxID=43366 RepID=A0AAN9PKK0_CLITE
MIIMKDSVKWGVTTEATLQSKGNNLGRSERPKRIKKQRGLTSAHHGHMLTLGKVQGQPMGYACGFSQANTTNGDQVGTSVVTPAWRSHARIATGIQGMVNSWEEEFGVGTPL